MGDFEGDSQAFFGLLSDAPVSETYSATESLDIWGKMNQLEFSLSRMERLPQTFHRVAQFFHDGSPVEGDRLLRHCLETLGQLAGQWPHSPITENSALAIGVASVVNRRHDSLELMREICSFRETKDWDSIAHCIEDELIMKLRTWELASRHLLRSLSHENY